MYMCEHVRRLPSYLQLFINRFTSIELLLRIIDKGKHIAL